ncbi:leucine-rich repeat flightless-interacting protein 2 isoform X10 [Lampetra planeri]
MGTPGRKRNPVRETFAAEDDALSHIAKEAEAKLASKRAARAEAREIRLRELERQQKDKYQLPRHNEEYDNIHQWMDGVEVPSTRLSRPQSRQRASPFSDADGLSERSGRSGSRREDYECERDGSSGRSRVKNGATKKYPLDHEERYSSRYHRVKPDDEELYSSQLGKYKPRLSSAERESESSDHRRIWQSDKYRRKLGSRYTDDHSDNDLAENTGRPLASRSAVSALSSSNLSSKQGNGDIGSLGDVDVSTKESLSEVQEKFKKAMVTNAQLDNEKFNLIYQVDTLRDSMEEMEEQMAELRRQHEDKCKDLERQKHAQSVLQYKYDELQEGLKQRDALIEKHGLVMVPEGEVNGEVGPDGEPLAGGGAVTLVSRQAAQLLEGAGDGPLDIRLKRLVEDKESLVEQVKSLKIQLEETKQKSGKSDSDPTENGMDGIETQRDVTRQLSEHKFKLSKAEQDITALEQSIARLEGQVARYKTASENAEKVEDELKAEKRKLQRELRSAQDRVEELEITNSQLTKRLEKIKSTRNVVLPQE